VTLPRLLRTAAFRLALAYAGLFVLSTAVLFVLVYVEITDHAEGQLKELIEDQAQTVVAQAKIEGFDALVATLRTWEKTKRPRPASYALVDSGGRTLVGKLGTARPRAGWFTYVEPEDDDDDGDDMLGFGTRLENGSLLVVAQETYLRELGWALIHAFVWAGGISLALAVLGGMITSAAFLRRLENFNRTAAHVIDGKLGERVPTRGTDDEFDRLAVNLNAMLERIQALMESMRQVSNDIAHDLRTPLSHLRQRLETARQDAGDTSTYELAVDGAIAETDEILSTFSALLRIAQIEAGTRRAGFAQVDLSAVFDTIAETYAPVAEDRGQSFVTSISAGIVVRGDRELLTQMLANLVENALRHTPPHSMVRLSLGQSARGPIGTVVDNGQGIPEEARGKVFRRFFRMEASRTTPGNGLGLSLVAAVADLHEVVVELADSKPGLGVTLRFPLQFASDSNARGAHPTG
jgi:signal transduction histidine kinase